MGSSVWVTTVEKFLHSEVSWLTASVMRWTSQLKWVPVRSRSVPSRRVATRAGAATMTAVQFSPSLSPLAQSVGVSLATLQWFEPKDSWLTQRKKWNWKSEKLERTPARGKELTTLEGMFVHSASLLHIVLEVVLCCLFSKTSFSGSELVQRRSTSVAEATVVLRCQTTWSIAFLAAS